MYTLKSLMFATDLGGEGWKGRAQGIFFRVGKTDACQHFSISIEGTVPRVNPKVNKPWT